jgi:hypothetical protein
MTSQAIWGWLLICAVAFVTLGPIQVRPVTGQPASLERLVAFGAVGAVFWAAYPKQRLFVLLFVLATVALPGSRSDLRPGPSRPRRRRCSESVRGARRGGACRAGWTGESVKADGLILS